MTRTQVRAFTPALVGLLLALPEHGAAQDACSNLLQQGVYDYFSNSGVQETASQMRNEVCTAYSNLMQSQQGGGGGVSVIGLFGGSVNVSSSELQSIASQMCAQNYSSNTAQSVYSTASRVIDAHAIDAWLACTQQYARGIQVQTTRTDDGSQVFDFSYVAPAGTPASTTIRSIVMDPPTAYSCSGTLMSSVGKSVGTQSLGMVCQRSVSQTPQSVLGRLVYAPEATIQVETDAGNITRYEAALPATQPPSSLLEQQVANLRTMGPNTNYVRFPVNAPVSSTQPLIGANGPITNPSFIGLVSIIDGYGKTGMYSVNCLQGAQINLIAGSPEYMVPGCSNGGPVLVNHLPQISNPSPGYYAGAFVTVIVQANP